MGEMNNSAKQPAAKRDILGRRGKALLKYMTPIFTLYGIIQSIDDVLHFPSAAKEVGTLAIRILRDIGSVLIIWWLLLFMATLLIVAGGTLAGKIFRGHILGATPARVWLTIGIILLAIAAIANREYGFRASLSFLFRRVLP